jgi:ectoine hydroxylase-related dioxygenase (phytanoyl-CoA dioxygenase family)
VSSTTSRSATQPGLDAAALRRWDRDGYHVERGLFDATEVAAISERFDRIARLGRPIPDHWAPQADSDDILARYPRVMHPHDFDPASKAVLLDPRVHRILVQLMNDEVLACQTMYYFKPPGARGQAFHQDNYYLLVQPYTCIAAWLAIDRSWPENGGLMVTPGTHRAELECPESADPTQSFTDDFVAPPTEPIGLDLAPGDVLFFTGSVIHGSGPNRTTESWRRSFISHYLPAAATHIGGWYLPHMYDFDGRPVTRQTTAWGGPCGEDSPKFRGFH